MSAGLFECALQFWSPVLGDPHLMGWLTVAVYLLAALATAHRALRGPFAGPTRTRERFFWWTASATLAVLAINKQLDLQSLLTAIGRCAARAQGWYENRQIVQRWFIVGILGGGAVIMVWLAWLMRRTVRRTGLAIFGLGMVCTFVAVRAAGFHPVDTVISSTLAGFRMNWLLELPGPTLVAWAALRGSTPT